MSWVCEIIVGLYTILAMDRLEQAKRSQWKERGALKVLSLGKK